jgi:hypothetical protein
MATTIQEMSDGVSTMSKATARVSEVASRQRESVQQLDESVQQAMSRIRAMSQLTDRLERRIARRVLVNTAAVAHWSGRSRDCEVMDLSETGVKIWLEGDLPRPGESLTVDLDLGGAVVPLRGSVVRTADGNPAREVAARFTGLRADEEQRLKAYLASLTTI